MRHGLSAPLRLASATTQCRLFVSPRQYAYGLESGVVLDNILPHRLHASSRVVLDPAIWGRWTSDGHFSTSLDGQTAARPYEHWTLAAELNTADANDIRRGAVVQKLWNAVDVRLRNLHNDYVMTRVRELIGLPRKTDTLEILEHLGLARPLILRRLKDLRNTVEHQDRGAPTHAECANLVDSVWYFLRSTDPFAVQRISSFDLSSDVLVSTDPERTQFVSIELDAKDWAVRLRGWFWPEELGVATEETNSGLVLVLEREPDRSDLDALYISGKVDTASEQLPALIRDVFAVDLPAGATASRLNHSPG